MMCSYAACAKHTLLAKIVVQEIRNH